MSHFTKVETQINDIDALRQATKDMGFELLRDTSPRGYQRGALCDFVIRLKGPYDIGLNKKNDGNYEITTDWFMGYVEKEVGENAGLLLQNYAFQKVNMEACRRGLMVNKMKQKDGSLRVSLRGF